MSSVIVEESGMQFGEYKAEDIFQIEKSESYVQKLEPYNVKTVEFILLRKKTSKENQLLFIEAKTSTPNYKNCKESEEKAKKYQNFISDITQKFSNSIAVYSSLLLERIHSNDFPEKLSAKEVAKANFVFILVIKNAFPDSLRHYQEKLQKELKSEMKIWGIQNLLVISEEKAKEKHLVT